MLVGREATLLEASSKTMLQLIRLHIFGNILLFEWKEEVAIVCWTIIDQYYWLKTSLINALRLLLSHFVILYACMCSSCLYV